MTPLEIIAKKRDGLALSSNEIAHVIDGYVRGDIPDFQMSALTMAIFIKGMNDLETASLTREMLHSGTTLRWPKDSSPQVDKHSTGGIGDKVSLILAPLLACCDLQVPMISGRGLGPTGGTLDKLESIPGFRTDLSVPEIQKIIADVGCVISGTTNDIVPADRKLYSLRDITATVASIPLITASIMSKKLAEGLNALVLDVKYGSGAFMKSLDDARVLAQSLVRVGREFGIAISALLTDMNQPLGKMIGNVVEVNESIATLQGDGPSDLTDLTLTLGAELLVHSKRANSLQEATEQLRQRIADGSGLEKFQQMVVAQGGDLDAVRPVALTSDVISQKSGYVRSMDAEQFGRAVIQMGGGRQTITDKLDLSVGLELLVRIGDPVIVGQPLAHIFSNQEVAESITPRLLSAIQIGQDPVTPPKLIVERIDQ